MASKKRRLRKALEAASVAAETPAAGEPQQAAVPLAGERRVEEVMEETAPSPVRAAAPPVAELTAEEFQEFCQEKGIKLNYASVAHPQSNGQVEKAMQKELL